MKKIYLIIIIAVMVSSCKDENERINEIVAGTWKLERMEYQDSTGITKVINGSDITLTFVFENLQNDNLGFQVIDKDTMRFKYALYSDCCNFMFELSDIGKMPIGGIGRMQLYDFNKIDKKTIEFYTAFEGDITGKNGKELSNTSYLYSKISN